MDSRSADERLDNIEKGLQRLQSVIGGLAQSISLLHCRMGAGMGNAVSEPTKMPVRVALPVWMRSAQVEELIGLREHRLKQMAGNGHVRRCKLGASIQSCCLYRSSDVLDAMERICLGLLPRIRSSR